MKSISQGLSLSRKELTALLAFAGQEEADKNKWGAQFRVEDKVCFARATNGYAGFQLEGINDGLPDGVWMVARKFLVDGQKELESKQVLRLAFSGASLHEGIVLENDVELGRWQSRQDVAITQISFPWDDDFRLPNTNRKIAHCCAVSAPYLKLIMLASKAVGVELAHFYSPKEKDGDLIFTVGDEGSTSGMGYLKPLPVASAAADEDGDDEEA